MKILVIGLGNPILGDDGVGWVVARQVEKEVGDPQTIEVDCLSLGGLSLMERMIGYAHVILIDSLNTGQHGQGEVISFSLDELEDLTYGHASAAHDATLKTAMETGRKLGAVLPEDKHTMIVAIEAQHVYEFQEELSPAIAAAVPVATRIVLDLLKSIQAQDHSER